MSKSPLVPARFLRRGCGALILAALAGTAACAGEEGAEEAVVVEDAAPVVIPPAAPVATAPVGTPAPPAGAMTDAARPIATQPGAVAVRLTEWNVVMSSDTVPAGPTTFEVTNTGTRQHALEVEGQGIEEETETLAPGATATLTVDLQPGRYVVYCPVEDQVNHQNEGMTTTLYVRE